MIKEIIQYGPTLLFLWIVLVGFVIGLIRGFRKSTILAIHALVAFIICTIIFFAIANSSSTDTKVVDIINKFMGDSSLQEKLGVSESYTSLSSIIKAKIIKEMDYGSAIAMIVEDDGAYIEALVSLAYHIVLFIIMLPVYWLLVFVLYIVYLIFYPERRHKAKIENDEEVNKKYKKHIFLGGAVGALRGTVKGVLVLSLIGALFYVIGGTGEKKYNTDYDFGSQGKNTFYDVYTAVGSYGNSGIYKILNTAKDKNEMPYYLYASSAVFSGNLDDDNRGINTNVKFVEEFGTYFQFSRDTFDLMLEVDSEAVINLMNDNTEENRERFYLIFENPVFQEKFSKLIMDFDSKVYFNNLILSTIESVANNIDNMKFTEDMSDKTVEVLKIMLKKDYLSDYIPEEREAKLQGKTAADIGGVATLDITNLLTREDTASLAVAILSILGATTEESQYSKVSQICDGLIPAITDLSILSAESRKEEVNPFFQRLYTGLNNIYLNEELSSGISPMRSEIRLSEVTRLSNKYDNLDWQVELTSLFNAGKTLIKLFDNVYTDDGKNINATKVIGAIFDVFDEENPKYEQNISYYNEVETCIENSKLLDMVLDSSFMLGKICDHVVKIYPDAYAYESINYAETSTGHGEFYNFLNAIEAIASDKTNKDILLDLVDNKIDTSTTSATLDLIDDIAKMLNTKDSENTRAVDYALSSKIVQSYLSAYILANRDLGDAILYIPQSSYEIIDGNKVNMISSADLTDLFDAIPKFIDIVDPYFDETSENYEKVDYILDELSKTENLCILDNKIIEGTISDVARVELSSNEDVKMPANYDDIDNWLSTDTKDGEIKALVKSVNVGNISISSIIDSDSTDQIIHIIKTLPEEAIAEILNSNILVYTLSNFVQTNDLDGVSIIVPYVARINLTNDTIPYKLTNTEIHDFILEAQKVLPESEAAITTNQLVRNAINNRKTIVNSYVLSTTMVNYFVNDNDEIKEQISIPEHLALDAKNDSTSDTLLQYNVGTEWYIELPLMLDSIEAYAGFTRDDSIDLDDVDGTETKLKSNIKNLNLTLSRVYQDLGKTYDGTDTRTILEICQESKVTYATISDNIESMLTEETVENPNGIIKPAQKAVLKDPFPYTYKSTVYNYKYYSYDEVKNLANVINELHIDIEEIVLQDIMDQFIQLNDPTELEEFEEYDVKPSKLDNSYKSEIFDILIYNTIFDEITRSNILVDGGPDSKTYTIHGVLVYTKEELSRLVQFVNVIDTSRPAEQQAQGRIRIGSITLAQIQFTDSQIETASNSYVISATITNQLVKNDILLINSSESVYDSENNSIKTNVLQELLTNIKAFTGLDTAQELVNYDIDTTELTTTNVQYIFASSILVDTISDRIVSNSAVVLNGDYCSTYNAIQYNASSISKYTIDEEQFEAFVLSLINLGFGDISAVTENDVNELEISTERAAAITSSSIMIDTVSKYVINNGDVTVRKDNDVSYQIDLFDGSDTYTLTEDALKDLLDVLIEMNLVKIDNINEEEIKSMELTESLIETITSSVIITDTASKYIITNENVVIRNTIPTSIVLLDDSNYYTLSQEELSGFLSSLIAINLTNISSITSEGINNLSLTPEFVSVVTSSIIMSDTVSKQVIENENVVVRNDEEVSAEITLYNNTNTYTLTTDALGDLLRVFIGMGLTNISTITEDTIKAKNFTFIVSTISNSVIFSDTVSKNILENENVVIRNDITTAINLIDNTNSYTLSQDEIRGLLNTLISIDLTSINSITSDNINNLVITSNFIEKVIESVIMTDTVSKQIIDNNNVVVTTTTASEITLFDSTTSYSFDQDTLEAFLNTLIVMNLNQVSSINSDTINSLTLTRIISQSICDSQIMIDTVSKHVIENEYVRVSRYETETIRILGETNDSYTIKRLELLSFLDCLVYMGLTEIDNVTEDSINNVELSYTLVDLYIKFSSIMINTISKYIVENNNVVLRYEAGHKVWLVPNLEEVFTISYIAISDFLDSLVTMGFTNINDITEENITNIPLSDDVIDSIRKSVIMTDTVSRQVIDNENLVVAKTSVESFVLLGNYNIQSTTMNKYDLEAFLDSLVAMNLTNVNNITDNDINTLTLDANMIDKLIRSNIMRDTISKHIINNNNVVIATSNATSIELLNDLETHTLDINELDYFLNALVVMNLGAVGSIDDTTINNLVLTDEMVGAITSSLIMTDTVSKNIVNNASVVISNEEAEEIEVISASEAYRINSVDLANFLSALIDMELTEVSNINTNTINNIELTNDIVISINNSSIMINTVSRNIFNTHSVIINVEYLESIQLLGTEYVTYKINNYKLTDFFNALIVMELTRIGDIDDDAINNLVLTNDMVDAIIESDLMKDTVSKNIINNEDISVINNDTTTFEAYNEGDMKTIDSEQLSLFLNALIDMELNAVGNIDGTTINTIVLNSEKVLLISQSNILAATVSKNIVYNDQVAVQKAYCNNQLVLLANNFNQYIIDQDKLVDFLNALIDMDLASVGSIDDTTVDSITLSSGIISAITSSEIMSDTVSRKIGNNADIVLLSSISEIVELTYDSCCSIDLEELNHFLTSLMLLGFTNPNTITDDSIQSLSINEDFITNTSSSVITKSTVSWNIVQNELLYVSSNSNHFNHSIVVIETTTYDGQDVIILSDDEYNAVLNGIIALGLGNVNAITEEFINSIEITKDNDYEMVNKITASTIISDTLSVKMLENNIVIVNNLLVSMSTRAYFGDEYFTINDYDELEAFLKAVADLDLGPVNSITEDSVNDIVLTDETALSITNSMIMTNIASKNIIENESVVVTIDVYYTFDKYVDGYTIEEVGSIESEELYKFLIALHDGLGITVIGDVTEENITLPQAVDDTLTDSDIMCATISAKIKCDEHSSFVQNTIEFVDTTRKDKDNNNINVVSQTEIQNFINASNTLDPEDNVRDYNTTISIETLKNAQNDGVLGDITISNIIRILISDVLLQPSYAPYITETPEYVSAIRIVPEEGLENEKVVGIFTSEQISAIVSSLPNS